MGDLGKGITHDRAIDIEDLQNQLAETQKDAGSTAQYVAVRSGYGGIAQQGDEMKGVWTLVTYFGISAGIPGFIRSFFIQRQLDEHKRILQELCERAESPKEGR